VTGAAVLLLASRESGSRRPCEPTGDRLVAGLLEIFRGRPGFRSYELIETGAGLISVSHWESSTQADAATDAAAAWVADRIDELVKLQQSDISEVVLSSLAAAATR
jgi:hypothetical protein